ncbi:hypothetical protein P4311_26415 [Bacillus thuringiensis]|nr:hypothetical protein [Bacillus thuringiensis]
MTSTIVPLFAERIFFLCLGVLEHEETYVVVILQQSVEVRQESKDS